MFNVIMVLTLISFIILLNAEQQEKEVIVVAGSTKTSTVINDFSYIRHIQHECGEYTKSDVFNKEEYVDFFEYCRIEE